MISSLQSALSCSSTAFPNFSNYAEELGLPLVSVIIPCHNGATFIGETIESALRQTYTHTEIIVIDDGSVDGSKEIILRYPVRYFYSDREGVSAARNRGMHESEGEYIIFLDADDRLLPQAVHTGLASLAQHPDCCMTVGTHNIISAKGEFICQRIKPLAQKDYYSRLLESNFIECTSTALFRRENVLRVGLFNIELHGAEDYDFYLRLARHYPICCHAEAVTEYRVHDTNASHDSLLMLTSTLRVIRSQRHFIVQHPRQILSYISGSLSWRRKYGRQLARELATNSNKTVSRVEHWHTLIHTYPLGAAIALTGRMLPVKLTRLIFRAFRTIKYGSDSTIAI